MSESMGPRHRIASQGRRQVVPRPLCSLMASTALVSASLYGSAYAQSASPPDTSAAPPATAADAGSTEVVVKAQRRSERLQSVPISLTAVSGDQIEQNHIEGIAGYLSQTPNVSFVNNGSRDRDDISIRGVSNDLNPYADIRPSPYAFYIDDFNVAAITTNPEVIDLSRIEILRGPQPTYFGRNAEAGAINIYTQSPTDRQYYEVGIDYSSFNTVKADAIVNVPVAPGLLDLRASGQSQTSDGNIKNVNPIGGGNNYQYYTGRLEARFTPINHLVWDATLDYNHENQGMRDGVPTGVLTSTWANIYYGCKVPARIAYAPTCLANPDSVGFFPNNTNKVNYNSPQSVGSEYYYSSSRAVYSFEKMDLTVVGGYGEANVVNRGDVDGGSHDYFNEIDLLNRQSSSIEARLASTDHGDFEWTVGVNAGWEVGKTNQRTEYGTQASTLPLHFPQKPGTAITFNYNKQHDDYQSIFAQGTYHLGPMVDILLGGRYTWETVDGSFLVISNGTTTTDNQPFLSSKFNDFSPAGTIKFKPIKDLIVYGTVSKGFKPGGVQSAATLLTSNYAKETLWNYEAGIKDELFNHRLRYDLSVYFMNWSNIQEAVNFLYETPAGVLSSISGVANAASAHSKGADASADFRVDPSFTISGHLGYDQANFVSYSNALVDGTTLNASGMPLVNAPKYTGGLSGNYHREIFGMNGFALLDWSYRSKTFDNFFALKYHYYPFIAPGYSNVNLHIGLEKGNISGTFYVQNLLDAKYFTNAYEKAFYSGAQVVPSFQQIGFSLKYKM